MIDKKIIKENSQPTDKAEQVLSSNEMFDEFINKTMPGTTNCQEIECTKCNDHLETDAADPNVDQMENLLQQYYSIDCVCCR